MSIPLQISFPLVIFEVINSLFVAQLLSPDVQQYIKSNYNNCDDNYNETLSLPLLRVQNRDYRIHVNGSVNSHEDLPAFLSNSVTNSIIITMTITNRCNNNDYNYSKPPCSWNQNFLSNFVSAQNIPIILIFLNLTA